MPFRSGGAARSLRLHLGLLVLAALVPMLLMSIVAVALFDRSQRDATERGAVDTARALVSAVDGELSSSVETLETLATDATVERGDLPAVHERLTRVRQPDWRAIQLTTTDGRILVDTSRPFGEPLPPLADPASHRRVVATGAPVVGDFTSGPADDGGFAVRVPARRGDRVRYVLSAIVRPETVDQVLHRQRVDPEWVVSIVDSRGVHVARSRHGARYVGQPVSTYLLASMASANEGWIPSRTLEGQKIYASFSRSPWSRWAVAVGVPAGLVEAPTRRTSLTLLAGVLLSALVAGVAAVTLARRVSRPVRRLALASETLGRGETPAPLPPSRIAEVDAAADALARAGLLLAERAEARERADVALRETNQRLQALVDAAPLAIIIVTGDGTVQLWNPAAERLLGWRADEVVGRPDPTVVDWRRSRFAARLASELAGRPTRALEADRRHRDGHLVDVNISSAPVPDTTGRPRMVMTILQDITERKRLYAAEQRARSTAEAANRSKDEFLATLSHELRTPLNAILGWTRMLISGSVSAADTPRALSVIARNADAQRQLIEDLLDVSRIITGKLHLDVRPVDLAAVVELALDSVRPAAQAKGVRLHGVPAATLAPVSGDAGRLQQIVWNLVSNAIKFTPRDGTVVVRLEPSATHVEIVVSDTGKGIAADLLPYVFDRFRQADSSSTRAYGGLGIGLALVKHLVELHGGTVTAESAGIDQGATFRVSFPTAEALPADREATAAVATRPPVALDGVRVLVVDDDADALDLLARLLAERGAETRVAHSAAEAFAVLAEWRPHVLVSDIAMPGENGYELIRRVRALPPEEGGDVAAVAVTAYSRVEDRIDALAAGFQSHVPKPADPTEIAMVVASLARRVRGR